MLGTFVFEAQKSDNCAETVKISWIETSICDVMMF